MEQLNNDDRNARALSSSAVTHIYSHIPKDETAIEQVVTFENLHRAAWNVFKGKRKNITANKIFFSLETELLKLQKDLICGEYRPGKYRGFWIYDPKPRYISASPLRDRIVHHSIIQVINPIFEKRFIYHSYACREGKGNHRAVKQFAQWVRQTKYALMLDIRKFFASIDHDILKLELRRGITDKSLLELIDVIIDCSNEQEASHVYFPGDELFTPFVRRKGIPIGNLTSQFLANVFMDRIDHFVKDKCGIKRYLRYVDDLAICHREKALLSDLRDCIKEHLFEMRLSLNEGKSRVRQVAEGINFLGFVVTPKYLRLAAPTLRKNRRRVSTLRKKYYQGNMSLSEVKQCLVASGAHAAHGDTWGLRTKIWHGPFCRGK